MDFGCYEIQKLVFYQCCVLIGKLNFVDGIVPGFYSVLLNDVIRPLIFANLVSALSAMSSSYHIYLSVNMRFALVLKTL